LQNRPSSIPSKDHSTVASTLIRRNSRAFKKCSRKSAGTTPPNLSSMRIKKLKMKSKCSRKMRLKAAKVKNRKRRMKVRKIRNRIQKKRILDD
jgi:hypothetical protein